MPVFRISRSERIVVNAVRAGFYQFDLQVGYRRAEVHRDSGEPAGKVDLGAGDRVAAVIDYQMGGDGVSGIQIPRSVFE